MIKEILFCIILLSQIGSADYGDSTNFNSIWNTSKTSTGSSTATQITLPLELAGTYNFTVWWGDGDSDNIITYNQTNRTHTYTSAGDYNLVIDGTLYGFRFNNVGDKLKLININQWGNMRVGNSNGYFYGASNFNSTATDCLNLTGTTNMSYMFRSADAFNQNISSWNVSSVTNMAYMFYYDTAFNQNISSWNVSKVTDMAYMFRSATAFNQNISSWNVSSVTNMSYMFRYATAFNQNISSWNVSKVTDMSSMFTGKLNTDYYNAMLNNWANLSVQNNVIFVAGTSNYNPVANDSRNHLNVIHGWIITDGGLVQTIIPPVPASCTSNNSTTWINISCSAGSGNITNNMEFNNLNTSETDTNSLFFWNNAGLNENTEYTYSVYAINISANNGTGKNETPLFFVTYSQALPILPPYPIIPGYNLTTNNTYAFYNDTNGTLQVMPSNSSYLLVYIFNEDLIILLLSVIAFSTVFIVIYIIYKESIGRTS